MGCCHSNADIVVSPDTMGVNSFKNKRNMIKSTRISRTIQVKDMVKSHEEAKKIREANEILN